MGPSCCLLFLFIALHRHRIHRRRSYFTEDWPNRSTTTTTFSLHTLPLLSDFRPYDGATMHTTVHDDRLHRRIWMVDGIPFHSCVKELVVTSSLLSVFASRAPGPDNGPDRDVSSSTTRMRGSVLPVASSSSRSAVTVRAGTFRPADGCSGSTGALLSDSRPGGESNPFNPTGCDPVRQVSWRKR